MSDITGIDLAELLNDREEALRDIFICDLALLVGVVEYSGGSVQERRDKNLQIVEAIEAELARRGNVQIISID